MEFSRYLLFFFTFNLISVQRRSREQPTRPHICQIWIYVDEQLRASAIIALGARAMITSYGLDVHGHDGRHLDYT